MATSMPTDRLKREVCEKRLKASFGKLKTQSEKLKQLIAENPESNIKEKYAEWMTKYEDFLNQHEEFCQILDEKDKQAYFNDYFDDKDVYINNFKTYIENWFSSTGNETRQHLDNGSISHHKNNDADNGLHISNHGSHRRNSRTHSIHNSKSVHGSLSHHSQTNHNNSSSHSNHPSIHDSRHTTNSRQASSYHGNERPHDRRQSFHVLDTYSIKSGSINSHGMSNESQHSINFLKHRGIELEAKAKALSTFQRLEAEKRKLEEAEMEIRFQEEQLDLQVQLEIVKKQRNCLMDEENKNHPDQNSPIINDRNMTIDENFRQNALKTADRSPELSKPILSQPPSHQSIPSQPQSKATETLIESIVMNLKKPACVVETFNGELTSYRRFLRQFNSLIINNTSSDEERLNYLDQYTRGEPNDIVRSLSYLDSQTAFKKILEELEYRYGDNERIANKFLDKALEWPDIKSTDPQALDKFALFLTECMYAVQDVQAAKVLEYSKNLQKILKKLPYSIRDKWRTIVEKEKGKVAFEHLVNLVKREARKLNDPVYGITALSNDNQRSNANTQKKNFSRNKSSFAIQTSEDASTRNIVTSYEQTDSNKKQHRQVPRKNMNNGNTEYQKYENQSANNRPCTFCKVDNHDLNNCRNFKALPYDDRTKFVKDNRLCFGCLVEGHMKRFCQQRETCKQCNDKHPTLLHKANSISKHQSKPSTGTVGSTHLQTALASHMEAGNDYQQECTMAIIPVRVQMKNSCRSIRTYAFLDPGSSVCFSTTNLMRQIAGEGKRRKITVDTMGNPYSMYTYEIQGMQVSALDSDELIDLPKVYSKDNIPVSQTHIPTQEDISRWSHLNGIYLPQLDSEIGLLIGNNVPDAYSPLDIRTGPSGSPHAIRSRLGWLIWNLVREVKESNSNPTVNRADVILTEKIEDYHQLENLVKQSIQFDFPERIINDRKENSQEDKLFLRKVEDSIDYQNGHYVINLPFKDKAILPDNHTQAESRLRSLKRKMQKNSRFQSDYCDFMTKILSNGYAELVADEELERNDGRVWYLPHHGVYHARKDKIRVVFDCAARFGGFALNDMLLQGPDLTNGLVGVLIRFRQGKYAVMGDIDSMFYQVFVPKEDRDFLRFLWWPNGNVNEKPSTYRMVVHLFGATSSPSCANAALRKTAIDNEDLFDSNTIQTVFKNFYVDDCLKSMDSELELLNLVKELCTLCQKGGFRVSKWVSSSRRVLSTVPDTEKAKGVKDLNLDTDALPIERALGICWSVENDTIRFQINLKPQPETRRGILSTVASVYDPLGLASPFILSAKLILQSMCQRGLGWDDSISDAESTKWNQWLKNIPLLEHLSVPRCYRGDNLKDIVSCQIHSFSDASDIAYGVVIYIRLVDSFGNVNCSPIIAKSRVAPLKRITIPRMELTAATISVKLTHVILRELELKVDKTFYWTDSMTVLRYIRNVNTRFHTFVSNRIEIIRDGTDVEQWRYVGTKNNPADDASRSITMNDTEKVNRWVKGPEFLYSKESEWPVETPSSYNIPQEDAEVKKTVFCTQMETNANKPITTLEAVIDHYSNWYKLKKAVGWFIIFIRYLQMKREERVDKDQLQMNRDILQKAEKKIVEFVQNQHFKEEIKTLKSGSNLKKNSSLLKLDPVLVEGTLRVGGRLSRSNLPFDSKHQMILPKNSNLSKLILMDIHKTSGHSGKNTMLSYLRERFWIPGASSLVKEITNRCVLCKTYRAKAADQKMADLPLDRVITEEPPFSRIGMDFFGPIEVKRGRSYVKRYGVIFTCLAVRAVHLEVASSLTTDSCINAIRRFIARRGPVKVIRSDNGTNLVGAEREMREDIRRWNQEQMKNELLQNGIDWKFNPPAGSHFGGVWERLIRSTRKILYSMLKERLVRLDDESLSTLLCEVEAVLNNRPLTISSSDKNDLEPITPNHLLLFRNGENVPPGLFGKNDNYANRRWRQVQYLSDIFWKRFSKEYLTLLQTKQKWTLSRKNVSVGDIVIVLDNAIRSSYTLGRVISVICDKKGFVRIVNVQTKSTKLQRPVHKISVILEADA